MDVEESLARANVILKSYHAFIFKKKSFAQIRELSLQGKAGIMRIRSFCWKVSRTDSSSYFLESSLLPLTRRSGSDQYESPVKSSNCTNRV